jgi:peptidyl-prolyl cis-trans isomerase SurA
MMRTATALLLTFLAAPALVAQQAPPAPGEELWDGVVAVVGDTVLLRSDVLLAVEQLRAGGEPVPTEPEAYEAFFAEVVQDGITQLMLVQGARAAGIAVAQEEVDQAVDQQVQRVRASFPTQEAFEAALAEAGRTVPQYREEIARQFADQTLVQRFVRRRTDRMPRPAVSDAEVRAFFEAQRATLPPRPATVSFQQVLVNAEPSPEARATARRRAEQVLEELRGGADFEVLARRHSMDGTRERGGDLGWFRQGQMVRPFEAVAFALRPGQPSGIVETEFGYHIIRIDRIRGPERQGRHILIRAEVTQFDIERARQRADSVARAVREGASMQQLAVQYGTPAEHRTARQVSLDRLPPQYGTVLGTAQPGDVVGPVQVEVSAAGPSFAVMRMTERQAAGEARLEDVEEQVRERLQEQKLMEMLIEDLRRETYVAVRG